MQKLCVRVQAWITAKFTALQVLARLLVFACGALSKLNPGVRVTIDINVTKKGERPMRRFMLELPDDVHLALKVQAAQNNTSMGVMIRKLIEDNQHGNSKKADEAKRANKEAIYGKTKKVTAPRNSR
jgi:plasmid stability protein